MTLRRLVCFRPLSIFLAMLMVAGCASVKTVREEPGTVPTRLRRPTEIWVRPFNTEDGMWQASANTPETRAKIRDWLTSRLLLRLETVAPTHLLTEDAHPNHGWLVTGRFLRVNPGSRLERLFLGGVGGGASRLETHVDVYDLAVSSMEPILSFTTTGGSNLAGGVPGAMTGADDDVDRTAREVRDFVEAHLWPADTEPGRTPAPEAMEEIQVGPRAAP